MRLIGLTITGCTICRSHLVIVMHSAFYCSGEGPFPAVLDLYTFGGGLSERRACLLANCGFMVLTLALYGHDDQPKTVTKLHLDYFEEAIQLLRKQPKVSYLRFPLKQKKLKPKND